ncbi:MAG: PAS domain S-box protein [ANME-2 cluster archaeon]|nr:PAS domain S-box protein [ANME-2 cluster archaeon]
MSSIGMNYCITNKPVEGREYNQLSIDGDNVFRTLDIFNEISLIFSEGNDLEETLTSVLEKALVITGMERGGIYLKERTSGDYLLTVHSHIREEFKKINGRITTEWESLLPVIIEGRVVAVSDTCAADITPERKRSTIREGFRSYVSIPLQSNNLVDGILMVSSSMVRQYSKFQVKLFSIIGQQIGLALKNIELMDKLRSSHEMYSELFENAVDGMYTHDIDGNFLSMNQAAADLLGMSIEEAVGTNIRDYLNEEGLEVASAIHAQLLNGKSFIVPPILEIIRKDGKRVFFEINMRPLMEDGRIVGLHGVARDIDKRFNAEKNMLIFSRALSSSIDGINISDEDHNITFINEAGAKIFGYSRSELVGQSADIFYAEEDLPNFNENIIPAIEKYGYYNGLILARKKSGKAFPLEVTLTSVFGDNGKTIAHFAVFRERNTNNHIY